MLMIPHFRVKVVRNRHGTARAALDAWLARNLCGKAVALGDGRFHVYGTRRRDGAIVTVEFTDAAITVVKAGAR